MIPFFMRRALRHLLSSSVFALLLGHTAFAAPSIQWQVDNPFRFFQYESDFEIQRWAYSELSDQDKRDNPASAIERKLNDPRWWKKTGADGIVHSDMLESLRQAEGRDPVDLKPRLG
jgi:hypothetical protein